MNETFLSELIEMLDEESGNLLHVSSVSDVHFTEVKLSREKLIGIADIMHLAARQIERDRA